MSFIVENWFMVVALAAVLCVSIYVVIRFLKMPTKEQINKVKEWLVFACMEAEKELGSKTGDLKLRMVYDMFLSKFNWLAKVISFDQFSKIVDESLETFKNLLKLNKSLRSIVSGDREVENE